MTSQAYQATLKRAKHVRKVVLQGHPQTVKAACEPGGGCHHQNSEDNTDSLDIKHVKRGPFKKMFSLIKSYDRYKLTISEMTVNEIRRLRHPKR